MPRALGLTKTLPQQVMWKRGQFPTPTLAPHTRPQSCNPPISIFSPFRESVLGVRHQLCKLGIPQHTALTNEDRKQGNN